MSGIIRKERTRVTFDTNVLPVDDLLALAESLGLECVVVRVTQREVAGSSFEATLAPVAVIAETAIWDESRFDEAVFADSTDCFEDVLAAISDGSFPMAGERAGLSRGQHRQLRDAMIFSAHVRDKREIFVTNDKKAFVKNGRRDALEKRFSTIILTRDEFREYLFRLEPERRT